MLPAYTMAKMVYGQLIKETVRLQKEVVIQNMVNASFGPDALPVKVGQFSNTLLRHREDRNRWIVDTNQRIEKNIKRIEEFEILFAQNEEESIRAFVGAVVNEMGERDANQ